MWPGSYHCFLVSVYRWGGGCVGVLGAGGSFVRGCHPDGEGTPAPSLPKQPRKSMTKPLQLSLFSQSWWGGHSECSPGRITPTFNLFPRKTEINQLVSTCMGPSSYCPITLNDFIYSHGRPLYGQSYGGPHSLDHDSVTSMTALHPKPICGADIVQSTLWRRRGGGPGGPVRSWRPWRGSRRSGARWAGQGCWSWSTSPTCWSAPPSSRSWSARQRATTATTSSWRSSTSWPTTPAWTAQRWRSLCRLWSRLRFFGWI